MIERNVKISVNTKDGTATAEIRGPAPSGPDAVLGRVAVVYREGVFGVLGADYHHEPSCDSDFCVGSGDEHSCNGSWMPCAGCGTMREVER